MKTALLDISIRQHALHIPDAFIKNNESHLSESTALLVAKSQILGFGFSESLLKAINGLDDAFKLDILNTLRTITGMHKNWTPLVKGWNVPTGESHIDHALTFFYNLFNQKNGDELPCGHSIPKGTFPLERYNGCPFCGTPFSFDSSIYTGQGSTLKVLSLWTDQDVTQFYHSLLTSKTPLDATQADSLKTLLQHIPLPKDIAIEIKETQMLVIDSLIENDLEKEAQQLFKHPNDILRYLWYKHTGHLQLITPKTILKKEKENQVTTNWLQELNEFAFLKAKTKLKLKYTRRQCKQVAIWLNELPITTQKACEIMHTKRGMWVRFIRALRLAEFSKRKGFEHLAELLDTFYNQKYTVWQGQVDQYKLKYDAENTFKLLKQRPGVFARSLFANILWFGPKATTAAFNEIIDQVPARLLFTLNMYADTYFDPNKKRLVNPLGDIPIRIPANKYVYYYDETRREEMRDTIEDLCLMAMRKRFANAPNTNNSIYIEPVLYKMPVAIGNRSETIQDIPSALMGTRFPIEGDTIRLFMQWGEGLPAQHLDMDLSCMVAYKNRAENCNYYDLSITGCTHGGDIQSIPEQIGTAEYININIDKLQKAGAQYVSFTCNAYTPGSISPNLVVGWMNSKHPMQISEKSGVAYDPSCVQHQVRVSQSTTKGLVFGVLDVQQRELIWLELGFDGQTVSSLDHRSVKALIDKLDNKLTIGRLLELKAQEQQLELVETPDADESYDQNWAINSAEVSKLFLD